MNGKALKAWRWIPVFMMGAGLAGCADGAAEGSQDVSLSFAANAAASAAALDPISGGGHTLDITAVDVTFSELVLERAEGSLGDGDSDGGVDDVDSDADSEADSDSDGPANEKFRTGPVTISLPVNGGVITPLDQAIPAGTYEQLELDIEFIRFRGTYDGQAFDVTVAVDEEFEADLAPLFVVDDDADRLNLTVELSVLAWFRNPDGSIVDPRLLGTNASLRELFVDRIEDAFDAYEDSDRDADDADSDSDGSGR